MSGGTAAQKNPDTSAEPTGPADVFSDEVIRSFFSFLDGENLAKVRLVCRKWNELACDYSLWKKLCVKKWKSLETDEALWKLVFSDVSRENPNKWHQVFPKVAGKMEWTCKLEKKDRVLCNLRAHQLQGTPLGQDELPSTIVIERRFNMLYIRNFIKPEASMLHLEPLEDEDKQGFNDFIEYLVQRNRAGFGLERDKRFIFVPPGEYTKERLGYDGPSLIGAVQSTRPSLQAA